MWDVVVHAVQLVETVPVLLILCGSAFVALDVLALYQLLKLYGSPAAAGTPHRNTLAAAATHFSTLHGVAGRGSRDVYDAFQQQQQQELHRHELQQQQEQQQQQHSRQTRSVFKRAWNALLRIFVRPPIQRAAAAGFYSSRRISPRLAATPHPVSTTTGGQTRFAFMVLLFAAILARAVSLFCMAWVVASRPAVPVMSKGSSSGLPASSLPAGEGSLKASVDSSSSARGEGLGQESGSVAASSSNLQPAPPPPAATAPPRGALSHAETAPVPAGRLPSVSSRRAAEPGRGGSPAAVSSSSSSFQPPLPSPPYYFNFAIDAEWCLLFLDSAPTLIFFASLSLIVLFWAKIYYAALLVSYPKLERCHWLCSGGLVALYVLFSLFAVALQAKRSATRALQLFIAMLFALAGGAFLVYGIKVARKLSERTKLSSRKSSIVRRVLFLSLACPILFGIRTLLALRGATPPLHPLLPGPSLLSQPLVTASAIFLLTEWVPAGLILAAFWHRKNKGSSVRSTQQQQLMHRQQQREQHERSFDSGTVAAPLMQQPYYPFVAPQTGYGDRCAAAPGADTACDETLPGEQQLGQPSLQQQQPGVTYQPCYPLGPGAPGYALGNASYPLQGYYASQYPQHYYPPPAL